LRSSTKISRSFALRRLATWVLLGAGLAALVTVGGSARTFRATTNRFVATTGSDSNNDCSGPMSPCATIQQAVDQSSSGDVIQLGPGTYKENVNVSQNVTIQGDPTGSTVDGNHSSAVFFASSTITATLSRLTITNGYSGGGGGIFTGGRLTVTNCTISNNSVIFGPGGGGILNSGTLTVTDSTISGNSVGYFPGGGGILNEGTLAVTNSTINGNSVTGAGGGIFNMAGTVTVTNSTISGNSATGGGGGLLNDDRATIVNTTINGNTALSGGGLWNPEAASLNLINTIIAGSTSSGDCYNVSIVGGTNSHNFVQDGSCSPAASGDPKLGPLQNNGGPTFTHALLAGSPAIDAGDDAVVGAPFNLSTDQRDSGFFRKSGSHVDIGAFEFQQFDTCLRDNGGGNLLQWNSTTGQYKFSRCADGFVLTGTGVVGLVHGIRTLTDVEPDRAISASFDTGQLTGSAKIKIKIAKGVRQVVRIVDTNRGALCSC